MPTIKTNKKAIQRLREKTMETASIATVNLESAAQRLRAAMAELETVFVNRTEEIAGLTLAVATGQHILLEGKPGVAKSDLAREVFLRIEGARFYDKMFNKGTSHDDVFGPTLMERYKQGVWEHNIEGALPTAHFANLEELGRASDVLLPSMMTVLNERIFHNGNNLVKCPLITAFATTNFLSDEEELAAFNDRWLVHMIVKPLENAQQKGEMILRSISERKAPKCKVTLLEIKAINDAARKIQPDDEVISLFVDLAQQYQKAANIEFISDRRLVAAFKLARARAVIEGREKVIPDDLEVIRYGLSQVGKADETVFTSCLQRVVGDVSALKEETKRAKGLVKWSQKLTDEFDPDMDPKRAKEVRKECIGVIDSYRSYTKPIKSPENSARFNEAIARLESLKDSLDELLKDVADPS